MAQQGLKSHGQLSYEKCENWQMGGGWGLRLVPAPWKMQGEGGLSRCCLVATTCQLCISQSAAASSEKSWGGDIGDFGGDQTFDSAIPETVWLFLFSGASLSLHSAKLSLDPASDYLCEQAACLCSRVGIGTQRHAAFP